MAKFKTLDEILEVSEDASLVTAAYNLALQHAASHCKRKAEEFYSRSSRWQHHQGAGIGADLLHDEILRMVKDV